MTTHHNRSTIEIDKIFFDEISEIDWAVLTQLTLPFDDSSKIGMYLPSNPKNCYE